MKYFFAAISSLVIWCVVAFVCGILMIKFFPRQGPDLFDLLSGRFEFADAITRFGKDWRYLFAGIVGIFVATLNWRAYLRKVQRNTGKAQLERDVRLLKSGLSALLWLAVLAAIAIVGLLYFPLYVTPLGLGVFLLAKAFTGLRTLDKYEFEHTTDGGVVEFDSYEGSLRHRRSKFLYGVVFVVGGIIFLMVGVIGFLFRT